MLTSTLFLDFDGVLNNDRFLRYQKNHVQSAEHRLFDPTNIAALVRLVDALAIETVVVTSTWRKERSLDELGAILAREGFHRPAVGLSATVVLGKSFEARGDEIAAWLDDHAPGAYLVLDDFDLGNRFGNAFHKIEAATGLTNAKVDELIARLVE